MMKYTLSKEFIFDFNTQAPSCHASTLLPLPNGDIIAAWFAGTKEGCSDVGIWYSLKSKGLWSAPTQIEDEPDIAHWNPVLHLKKDGTIRLYFKVGETIAYWYTKYCDSLDLGKSFQKTQPLVDNDKSGGRGPVKNKCIRLSDGSLLAPASTEQGGQWRAFIDVSQDDGDSFTKMPYIVRPRTRSLGLVHMIQPTLWEAPNGHIHALMRSNKGNIYRSDSLDYGKTWCKAYKTELPNNNSGIDCVKTDDGLVWLLFNPISENWGDRSPLRLSVSYDNGQSFNTVTDLETKPDSEFAYPAITASGNKLFMTYTYQREKIAFAELEYTL